MYAAGLSPKINSCNVMINQLRSVKTSKFEIYFKELTYTKELNTCILKPLADPGGAAGTPPHPPTGSNSFIFAYVFTEKCLRRRSAPPPRPQWEILDPPLKTKTFYPICLLHTTSYHTFHSFLFMFCLFAVSIICFHTSVTLSIVFNLTSEEHNISS